MENEKDIKKHLPMLFELDFGIHAPAFIHNWHNMLWEDFEKKTIEAGIDWKSCKYRDWNKFFIEQQTRLTEKT
ncbi:MAG TPA: hypothetical protein VF691_09345 [Cytophagaceae bacterium]|jgi:hypothetical protein